MISGEQIELVLLVIKDGSFSAAARRLGRTPSAVSMAISNIEADLGFFLFDRSKREPTPTPELTALLPEVRIVAERLDALRLHIQQLTDGLEPAMTLGLAADLPLARVHDALDVVAGTYPGLQVNLVTAPREVVITGLHEGRLDAAIAYGDPEIVPQEAVMGLWTERIVAVAAPSHPLTRIADLAIEDLHAHRQIVVASPEHPVHDRRSHIAAQSWKVGSLEQVWAIVAQGKAWGNLPLSIVRTALKRGELVELPFSNIRNGLDLQVAFRSRKGDNIGPAARLLIKTILKGTGDQR